MFDQGTPGEEPPLHQEPVRRLPARAWHVIVRIGRAVGGAAAWAGRVFSGIGPLTARVWRLGARTAAWASTITFGTAAKWAAIALAACLAIAFGIVLFLVFYPDTQIPAAEPIAETRYLDQGWGIDRASPDRETYYYTAQGASLKGLRYSWFVNLERPWGRQRFADPAHLRSLGFVVDPMPTHANPDQLPVGFARHFDDAVGEDVLDITCSVCHTGQLNVTKNGHTVGIRIDGGAAMHALPAVEIGHFAPVLLGSMASTYFNPFKFNRFARKVLGDEAYSSGKSELHGQLWAVLSSLLARAVTEKRHGLYPVEEGFGRTDAVGRISNTVFGEFLDPKNFIVADAPVSYPYVWNIWKFDWVQYIAFVSQPMARNVGEVLGTGATYALIDRYGRPIPPSERYRTSVQFDNLQKIESVLQKLKPPPWPEELLGKIDQESANRGRILFKARCEGCHGPHDADAAIKKRDAPLKTKDDPQWLIRTKDITDIGTDPTALANAIDTKIDLTRTGLTAEEVRDLLKRQLETYKGRAQEAFRTLKTRLDAAGRTDPARGRLQEAFDSATATLALPDDAQTAPQAAQNTQWTEAEFGRILDGRISRRLDAVNLQALSIPEALNIVGLIIRERYYKEHAFTPDKQACYEGFGTLDLPEPNNGYKPRPLGGVWATPPFLHNGSVPTLYALLSPVSERPTKFFVGRREFDRVNIGFVTEPLSSGGFWFDTRVKGNANTGHEFRAGYVEYNEKNPLPQYGVIGPAFTPAERYDIIEYLKIRDRDEGNGESRTPVDCAPAPPSLTPLQKGSL